MMAIRMPLPAIALLALLVGPLSALAQDAATTAPGPEVQQNPVEEAQLYLRDNPISPPDTTSPRATLESFVFIMKEASRLWHALRKDYEDSNNIFLTEDQRADLVMITALLDKAAQTFDLSEIPVTSRESTGIEIALQLQEILDRIPPTDISAIPGFPPGQFTHSSNRTGLPGRWLLPSTSIGIMRQEDGEQQEHYLFSKDSVRRIPSDYAVVSALPLQADRGEDLFQYYNYTPGNFIAPRWYEFIQDGPEWLHLHLADQAYWQWLALLLLVAVYAASVGFFVRWRRWRAVSVDERTRVGHSILNPLLVILGAVAFRYLCEEQINITGKVLVAVATITTAVIWSATAWLVYHVLQLIYLWFVSSPGTARQGLDVSLLRTGFRVFSLAISLIVLGYGATQIGIPIYGVIAGLGVGGLAIALAAQPTIENLIGGIILYADRMVRVGEFCKFDELAGTIESIGIRSTRIRALDRTVITIANSDLARRKIINYSERDQFHFRHTLTLQYKTAPEVLKATLVVIRDYLKDNEKVVADPMRVLLIGFNDYAVKIEVYAYVICPDYAAFLETQEEMLFDIRTIVDASGSHFAYPSSTVYLSRDSGLPAENGAEDVGAQPGKDSQAA
ncbi:mechanosensitive ion channel protein MscS [Labrenzia sp. 011]|nr:mechanosensitive ion channel protein MscS [Labrenzia sp. 011]